MYKELDQLNTSITIQKNFNQKKLFQELINSRKIGIAKLFIKKNALFSQKINLKEQICYLQEGIVCSFYRGIPNRVITQSQFLNVELILGMEEISIKALTNCRILVFDRLNIMEHIFAMQKGILFLFQYEKEQEDFLISRIDMLRKKGYPRFLQMLKELADECGEVIGTECHLPKCFTIKRIASLSGLSTNTVSLFRKKMMKDGTLRKDGGQFILLKYALNEKLKDIS